MLKELPIEFKDIIKPYTKKEGFIGLLDGLILDDNIVKGTCVIVFDTIDNYKHRDDFELIKNAWKYQSDHNLSDSDQCFYVSAQGYGNAYLNEDLPFVKKEEVIRAIY